MEAGERRPGQGGGRHGLWRALEAGRGTELGLQGLGDSPLQKGRSHWLPSSEANKMALVTGLGHLVIETGRG